MIQIEAAPEEICDIELGHGLFDTNIKIAEANRDETELRLDPLPLLTPEDRSDKVGIAHIATAGRAEPSISS